MPTTERAGHVEAGQPAIPGPSESAPAVGDEWSGWEDDNAETSEETAAPEEAAHEPAGTEGPTQVPPDVEPTAAADPFFGMSRDQASFIGGLPLTLPPLPAPRPRPQMPFGQVPVTFDAVPNALPDTEPLVYTAGANAPADGIVDGHGTANIVGDLGVAGDFGADDESAVTGTPDLRPGGAGEDISTAFTAFPAAHDAAGAAARPTTRACRPRSAARRRPANSTGPSRRPRPTSPRTKGAEPAEDLDELEQLEPLDEEPHAEPQPQPAAEAAPAGEPAPPVGAPSDESGMDELGGEELPLSGGAEPEPGQRPEAGGDAFEPERESFLEEPPALAAPHGGHATPPAQDLPGDGELLDFELIEAPAADTVAEPPAVSAPAVHDAGVDARRGSGRRASGR